MSPSISFSKKIHHASPDSVSARLPYTPTNPNLLPSSPPRDGLQGCHVIRIGGSHTRETTIWFNVRLTLSATIAFNLLMRR
jgi:hypothetical protein